MHSQMVGELEIIMKQEGELLKNKIFLRMLCAETRKFYLFLSVYF
mgnify:CR=1 FL=1